MLWAALAIVAAVAAGVLVAVFAPVDLTFSMAWPRVWRPSVRVRWLFGLVKLDHDVHVQAKRREKKATPRKTEGDKRERRRPRFAKMQRGGRIARGLVSIEGLATATARLAAQLVKAVRWRRLDGALRLGLPEPSDTGEVCGVMGPLLVFAPRSSRVSFHFEPDFTGPAFELQAAGSVRVVPADVLGALLRYVLSAPVLRGIKVVVWDSRLETS